MNKLQKIGDFAQNEINLTTKQAMAAINQVNLRGALSNTNLRSIFNTSVPSAASSPRKNEKVTIPSEAVLDERYDRMCRKDFSRKVDAFPPTLVNDSYAKFRFSKRAGEVISPLNKSKFGLSARTALRKLSCGQNSGLMKIKEGGQNSVQ